MDRRPDKPPRWEQPLAYKALPRDVAAAWHRRRKVKRAERRANNPKRRAQE